MIHRLAGLILVVIVIIGGGGGPPLLPLPHLVLSHLVLPHLVGGSVEAKLGGEVLQALNPRTGPFAQPPDHRWINKYFEAQSI